MLKIRLQRIGRKNEPVFRFVLTDSKNSTKSGKFLEILGNYDSRHGEKKVMNTERMSYWMNQGAQVTPTVHNFLVDAKVISSKKVNSLPKKKPIIKETPVAEVKTAKAPVVEVAPVETIVKEGVMETVVEAPVE